MVATLGYKRVSGLRINAKIAKIEQLSGDTYKIHCSPGIWMSTQLITVAFGESYTDYIAFYASGNVVSYPEKYAPNGALGNNANSILCGGTRGFRAREGDCAVFPSLGVRFYITRAEPGVGDSFASQTTDNQIGAKVVGNFISLNDLYASGSNPNITITDLQTTYGGSQLGVWTSWGAESVRLIPNSQRPYEPVGDSLLDGIEGQWDHIYAFDLSKRKNIISIVSDSSVDSHYVITSDVKHNLTNGSQVHINETNCIPKLEGIYTVGYAQTDYIFVLTQTGLITNGTIGKYIENVPGNIVVSGSHNVYFNYQAYAHLFDNSFTIFQGQNNIGVKYRINGDDEQFRQTTINNPFISIDGIQPATWSVYVKRRDTGVITQLTYGGPVVSDVFLYPAYEPFTYRYNANSHKVILHPNLAGDYVEVHYTARVARSMSDFGTGLYLRDFQQGIPDRTYLKCYDCLWLRDECAVLQNAWSALTGVEFYISPNGVMSIY